VAIRGLIAVAITHRQSIKRFGLRLSFIFPEGLGDRQNIVIGDILQFNTNMMSFV
jgi:hypothetical protein